MRIDPKHLKSLSSEALISSLRAAVRTERESTTAVLHHFREVELRQLHLKAGYDSLHTYMVEEHGYCDGSAHRRIKAMRLMQAMPEIEEKIVSGALNLTTTAIAQRYFEKKSVSHEAKRELLGQFEGKSKEEAERLVITLAPELAPAMKERVKPVSETLDQVTFVMDQELKAMIERIRALSPYQEGYLELFKFMARKTLEKLEPGPRKSKKNEESRETFPEKPKQSPRTQAASAPSPTSPEKLAQAKFTLVQRRTRYIAVSVERAVWKRDESQCAYIDSATGRRCSSRVALQLDHFPIPFALGGESTVTNLRLACPAHNRFTNWKPNPQSTRH